MKTVKAQLSAVRFGHSGTIVYKILFPLTLLFLFITMPSFLFAEDPAEKIKQEAGFYYTVKKGDTLWDLSERFSDSPWVWPDLWQENKQIPNPHWIYPGNRIRLYHKGWIRPLDKPVERKMEEPVYFLYKNIDMVGFIRKEAIPPSALIFKTKYDKELISSRDLVYLRKEEKSDFLPGSRYTVYRTLKKIKDKQTGEYVGIQHYLTGVVEVVQDKDKFAVGKVIYSFRPIKINDKLMPYTQRSIEIPIIGSTPGVDGKMIISEENQEIFGDNTIAFFDKGKKDGVKIGQIYGLFDQKEATLDPKTREKVTLPPTDVGEILILHTEETTSTVIITKSYDPVISGTKVTASLD